MRNPFKSKFMRQSFEGGVKMHKECASAPAHERCSKCAPSEAEVRASRDEEDAVKLAERMARVAGRQRPSIMMRATYILLCTAALASDPDKYAEWLERKA